MTKTHALTPWLQIGRFRACLEFKLADLWVGLFWIDATRPKGYADRGEYHIWLCLVPMFPIHMAVEPA